MQNIIETAQQLTPERLTVMLQKKNQLPQGKVTAVTIEREQTTFASKIWHLSIAYSPLAPAAAPRKLFLKHSSPALAPGEFNAGQTQQEIDFYQLAGPAMNSPFLIPCFDAAFDEKNNASHLLLQDVSDTHFADANPQTGNHCELVMDALAQLHAFWWDHPWLGIDIGEFDTKEQMQSNWQETAETVNRFLAHAGETIPTTWRKNYQQVVQALPSLYQRHESRKNLTLVHGDAHLGNFLFPKDAPSSHVYMLDWQFWHPSIGGTDLAFLMATDWEIETRRKLQDSLLRRYYEQLVNHGITGYTWEECRDDYRLSVILVSIFIPVWRWAIFQWEIKASTIEQSMTAFEDLDCQALLQ